MHLKVRTLNSSLFIILLLLLCSCCKSFNLDTRFSIVYKGSKGSFFGYTTALHKNRWGYLALIGAPKANTTTFVEPVYQPGTLFSCNISRSASSNLCKEVFLMQEGAILRNLKYGFAYEDKKDNMWLGVSLDVRPSLTSNDIVTCGHLWKNQYHHGVHLVNGVCYVINGNLDESSVKKLLPLTQRALQYGKDDEGFTEYNHALGQAGMSMAFSLNGSNLILGAPGVWSWKGSIVNYGSYRDYSNDIFKNPIVPHPPYEVKFNSYFGYSVTTGKFFNEKVEFFAVGAPKDGYNGKVYIVKQVGNYIRVHQKKQGLQMGEYFGACVLGVDLNGDFYTDLLIGAPLNSLDSAGDEGKVYVYISNGKDLQKSTELTGDKMPNGRFGTAIANIGDLNQDGFFDVAVGAPYENEQGAVYIYHGSNSGIKSRYVQKIEAASLNSKLSGFGIHISRGMDIDNNKYPDILIGSYASSDAVLLRSRPIIRVVSGLTFTPKQININQTTCEISGVNLTCVWIDACLSYNGKHVSNSLEFHLTLFINDPMRRGFFTDKRTRKSELNMVLDIKTKVCSQFQLFLHENLKDVITPIPVQFSHELVPPADFDKSFDQTFPIYHPESRTNITSEIPFHTGCGKDNECHADLIVSATRIEPAKGRLITLGMSPSISISISVKNIGEPAYLSELLIDLPPELPSIKQDYFCDVGNQQNNASIVCDLGNPLTNQTQISPMEINIKLDATKIPPHTKYLEIVCRATTISIETNPDDNVEIVPLHLETRADIGITGISSDNQIMHDGNRESSSVITHTYITRNYGPSPLQSIDILIQIPYLLLTSDGEKELVTFAPLEINSESGLSIPAVCEVDSLSLRDVQRSRKDGNKAHNVDRELLIGEKENSSNVLAPKDSIGAPSALIMASDVQPKNLDSGNNSVPVKTRGSFTIDCIKFQSKNEMIKDVQCVTLQCSAAMFNSPRKFSQISLGFQFNFSVLDKYLSPWYEIEFVTLGYVSVNDDSVVQLNEQNDLNEIRTILLREGPPPPEELAPWIIFVSVGVGIGLLLLILIVLIKIGFFRRIEKDQIKQLRRETNLHQAKEADVLPQQME